MTKPLRHRWSEPSRPSPWKTERTCLRPGCNIVKVTRHEGDRHWQEFWKRQGEDFDKLEGEGTPACEGIA